MCTANLEEEDVQNIQAFDIEDPICLRPRQNGHGTERKGHPNSWEELDVPDSIEDGGWMSATLE